MPSTSCLLVILSVLAAIDAVTPAANAACPDPAWACPGTDTCCKNTQDQWACCGIASAVCCEDRLHCCPAGTTCGLGGCVHGYSNSTIVNTPALKIPTVQVILSSHRPSPNSVCPDPSYACPGSHTCCLGTDSRWKCCDLDTTAVCCADRPHCCPAGTECGVTGCSRRSAYGDILTVAPFLVRIPATKVQKAKAIED